MEINLTERQIELVQESFAQVLPIVDTAASLFYSRLFELDPGLEDLFKGNLKEQGRKLMRMIGIVVKSLNCLPEMLPVVRSLGERHGAYGVRDEDYKTVGEALLWTLARGLGAGFTPEVKEAWEAVYTTLATAMKSAVPAPAPTANINIETNRTWLPV